MSFLPWTPTTRHDTYPAIDPSSPYLSSSGKIVIITGGSRGIGKATALAFAKSRAKAVIITGRTEKVLSETAAEIRELGAEARYFAADIVDQNRIQEVFASVKKEFGRIDVVVSNAGYLPDEALIRDAKLDDWWRAFEVNTMGAFIAMQAFVLYAQPGANLISIISALAHIPYFPGFSSYGASKLAAVKLLQDAQVEYPELRFFSIQPGLIDTETSSKSDVPAEDTGK